MAGNGRRSARSRIKFSPDVDGDRAKPNPKFLKHRNRNRTLIPIPKFDLKALLVLTVVSFFIVLFLIQHFVKPVEESQKHRVVTPFPAPKIMDLPQFQGEHKESLYWGTYRPHVYLGIRARTPQSLVAGLMWIGVKDRRYSMRHICQDSDELKTYGWTRHNGRDYGHQTLLDQDMMLMTSFLKSKEAGSGYGGDWAVRIDVQSEKPGEDMLETVHLFFYLADEAGNALSLSRDLLDIREDSLLAFGLRTDVGSWNLHLESKDDLEVHYSGFNTPHIHNLSDLVMQNLGIQISGRAPFRTDIAFISGTELENSRPKERLSSLTGTLLTSQLNEKEKEFEEKFKNTFNLSELDPESISTGKAAIGNLLGGIGYFYGQSRISLPRNSNLKSGESYILYWPAELYTAVPSRPFFPRGFLWDEGFHQLLIWRWDIYISLDIMGHWLDLMNIDGWIPREQILGAEALSKVPEEFVVQHPTNGNPPTLFLVLRDLVCATKRNKFTATERDQISSFLDLAFIRLEAWFQWFNTTQSGKDMGSYFWHGRDNSTTRELNPKALSSGLDDYPRASHPSEEERHLDLRCWMLLAADCMYSISKLLGKERELGKEYGSTAKLLSDFGILNQMHFDDSYGAYFDFGNHTEKVQLSWREVIGNNHHASRELVQEVLEQPKLRFVPHVGYVSLFPFVGRIIPPDSSILEQQLNLISNRSILWTDYGLRSLSKTSSMYMKRNTEHDPPYWRGPIWMNMNYLILSSLHHYSKENGPYRDRARTIYHELRSNVIRNVVRNYQQTGYFWEQFDQKKGKGKGARVFTGWTSLVLLIMAEAYGD
ncbi:mannosyl-oligosaccharide glucosidase GCS1-like isoform X2 [Diospyros lotus]|uniref:mannosyl-oligosaccharide glucosidase GCS1-like isoform X2 n=1 Tax=Diospyros lotus TaxID=55363 RepID=UPI0022592DEB|nr:mannosyl-oligosaccharide glucosidase GCS1-like isoform X2 [Diospyros lotus]